jgi:hypothetical protein
VFGFEALDPRIDGGAEHVQEAPDAQLLPALIIALDDLQPRLVAIGLGMIVPEPQVTLIRDGALLPELLDGLIINGIPQLDEQDAGEFPGVEPVIEGFESIELLPHGVWDLGRLPPDYYLHIVWEQPEHPLLPKLSGELPHGGRVGLSFLGALLRCPVGEEDHRADHFIAPLDPVRKLQLQLCKVLGWHRHRPPAWSAKMEDL